MFRWRRSRSTRSYVAGLCTGLLIGSGMLVGGLVVFSFQNATGQLTPEVLRGSAAAAGDTLAIATGPIDRGMEGVFFLDGLTGKLQGGVLNPKTGTTMGAFVYPSVYADLGIDKTKNPKLLMVTGTASFQSGSNVTFADSIVYVAESATGNWAAYALPWNKNAPNLRIAQAIPMVLIGTGKARDVAIRD